MGCMSTLLHLENEAESYIIVDHQDQKRLQPAHKQRGEQAMYLFWYPDQQKWTCSVSLQVWILPISWNSPMAWPTLWHHTTWDCHLLAPQWLNGTLYPAQLEFLLRPPCRRKACPDYSAKHSKHAEHSINSFLVNPNMRNSTALRPFQTRFIFQKLPWQSTSRTSSRRMRCTCARSRLDAFQIRKSVKKN